MFAIVFGSVSVFMLSLAFRAEEPTDPKETKRKTKAIILGGLATAATFMACGCLAGITLYIAALILWDDDRSDGVSSNIITVLTLMGCVIAFRSGRLVGRDWYRGGRD